MVESDFEYEIVSKQTNSENIYHNIVPASLAWKQCDKLELSALFAVANNSTL